MADTTTQIESYPAPEENESQSTYPDGSDLDVTPAEDVEQGLSPDEGGTEQDAADMETIEEETYVSPRRRRVSLGPVMSGALKRVAKETSSVKLDELERTDTDDLFAPTASSPEDQQERMDVDDLTGLSSEDRQEIIGGDVDSVTELTPEDEQELLGVEEQPGSDLDSDLSGLFDVPKDLFTVRQEDIIGTRKRRPPLRKQRYVPPSGTYLGGVR